MTRSLVNLRRNAFIALIFNAFLLLYFAIISLNDALDVEKTPWQLSLANIIYIIFASAFVEVCSFVGRKRERDQMTKILNTLIGVLIVTTLLYAVCLIALVFKIQHDSIYGSIILWYILTLEMYAFFWELYDTETQMNKHLIGYLVRISPMTIGLLIPFIR